MSTDERATDDILSERGAARLVQAGTSFLVPDDLQCMARRENAIRHEHRWFYPIDWPQLSAAIRFGRAKGRCERCRRPHGRLVFHLGDGRPPGGTVEAGRSHCWRTRPLRMIT